MRPAFPTPVRAAAGVLALLVAGAPLLFAGTAEAASAQVSGGSAAWGYKQSFRGYVAEETGRVPGSSWPQARASITVSGGASFVGSQPSTRTPVVNKAPYRWPVSSGSIDRSSGKGTVHFGGAVTFAYPNHYIGELRFANPTVVLDGRGGGSLLVDIRSHLHEGQAGETPVSSDKKQVKLATLSNARARTSGSTTTLTNAGVALTAAGAKAADDFYTAGEALDPISFSVTTRTASTGGGTGNGSGGTGNGSGGTGGSKATGTSTRSASPSASGSTSASASPSAAASASAGASASASSSAAAVGAATPIPSISDPIAAPDTEPVSNAEDGSNLLVKGVLLLIAVLAALGMFVLFRQLRRSTPSDPNAPTDDTQEN